VGRVRDLFSVFGWLLAYSDSLKFLIKISDSVKVPSLHFILIPCYTLPIMSTTQNTTSDKALALLADGLEPAIVASALGISPSRISQLLSEEDFTRRLAELRFGRLQENNARDKELDNLEDQIIRQLKTALPMAMRPGELARLLQIVNAAKRRGQSAPVTTPTGTTIIKLSIPTQIINHFALNSANQVIAAGEQSLLTIQSGQINKLAETVLPRITQNESPSPHRASNKLAISAADFGFA